MQPKEKKNKKAESAETEEAKILTASNQLKSFLVEKKDDHYQFEKPVDVLVPSGSLIFDFHLDGGIGPGLHRFTGINEGGKSSSALGFLFNFLSKKEKRRGVLMKAEGRLSKEMMARSGIKFVFSAEEWTDGTCFVFESNIYETTVDLMRTLVKKNDEGIQYFFILDSVDGLILKNDLDKDTGDSNKVAGGAVIAGTLMKKMAIALQKRGHVAIFISQVRADVQLDPYSKEPVRQTTATGGNALLHFANYIFEFNPRWNGDLILENPDEKPDVKKNPILGHFCSITVKKSPNEITGRKIRYPIKYGRTNGTSNWLEKEVFDILVSWNVLNKKGAWISWQEDFFQEAKNAGIDLPEKIQGINRFDELVENDVKVREYLINYCKNGHKEDSELSK